MFCFECRRPAQSSLAALGGLIVLGGLAFALWFVLDRSQPVAAGSSKQVVNSLNMKFALIPKGTFLMGSPKTEEQRGADEDQHEVSITKDFYLGVHEVTQGQYLRVMGDNPSCFTPTGAGKAKVRAKETTQSPVECVSWRQAAAFCQKLADLAGEKAAKRSYRLPTEAEWEYACRAGTTTALHFGDVVESYSANFNGLSPYGAGRGGPFHRTTRPVGEYPANLFGLCDMHGNVMEWCNDWYAADYYKNSPKEDPQGPDAGTEKVTRGGSWSNSGKACRSAVRTKLAPGDSHYGLGFRVVLMQGK
jgi:formylglycine-generating enzyme required for sulfatase activity